MSVFPSTLFSSKVCIIKSYFHIRLLYEWTRKSGLSCGIVKRVNESLLMFLYQGMENIWHELIVFIMNTIASYLVSQNIVWRIWFLKPLVTVAVGTLTKWHNLGLSVCRILYKFSGFCVIGGQPNIQTFKSIFINKNLYVKNHLRTARPIWLIFFVVFVFVRTRFF